MYDDFLMYYIILGILRKSSNIENYERNFFVL